MKTFPSVLPKIVAITQRKGDSFFILFFKMLIKEHNLWLKYRRLERLWCEEVKRRGLEDASLQRVIWKFTRSRVLVNIALYLTSIVFGFIGPVCNEID